MESPDKTEVDRRANFVASLRELADFLERRPQIKTPYNAVLNVFIDSREELAVIARLATWKKAYYDTWFALRLEFGDNLVFEVNAHRETVCRKVVTGTRIIAAQPEHEVEIVEWVYDEPSLLAGGTR